MKQAMRILLFALFCVFFAPLSVLRAAEPANVYDYAELLETSEEEKTDEAITTLMEETGWNIYAVTTANAGGKSSMAYADDFFDVHSPEKEDGVCILIDMDNREIYISTCGVAIRYLTDSRIDRILDDAYPYVSGGDYAGCMLEMISGVESAYRAGIPSGQYNYDSDTGKISVYHHITAGEAGLAVILAIAAGMMVFFGIVGKYRLKFGTYQYDYHEESRLNIRRQQDRFINETVTHRRVPQNTGSSSSSHHSAGRSTTHHSSSGRSHGGGGRHF